MNKHKFLALGPTWCYQELRLGGPQAQEGELIDRVEVPDHRPRLVGDALHQAGHLRRCRVVKAALSDSPLHTHSNNSLALEPRSYLAVDDNDTGHSFVVLQPL